VVSGWRARTKCFAFIKMGLGWPKVERVESLRSTFKKTLIFLQNLENKGSIFFLAS
jgi:hypothetical protein